MERTAMIEATPDAGVSTRTGGRLDVVGVSKRFGGVSALDDVGFTVAPGEIFGVIGANGAGKSTLLGVISGEHAPTTGEVALNGARISGRGAAYAARHGIGRAHQVPRPFRQMTVRQHVDLAARLRPVAGIGRAERVDAVLADTGLDSRADRYARDLGLLDLKRLEVARAMGLSAEVLLLDEVAAGLVGQEVQEMISLIDKLRASGTTIVMVEHVQALIRELAERVLVLDWGQVLATGTPAEVAVNPLVIEAYLGRSAESASPEPQAGAAQVAEFENVENLDTTSGVAAFVQPAEPSALRPSPILVVDRLTVAFGKQLAVRDVSLTVGPGEIVAVVGANGAGKTTLTRAIAGMVPSSGTITLDGQQIGDVPSYTRARKGIALCHEGRRLFSEQTVADNLAIAARYARTESTDALIDGAYDLFPELDALRTRTAGNLSGGQQQMVAIARALVLDPQLIMFDELSLGLAPVIVERLFAALPTLRDRGLAIMLVEQNVNLAIEIADHVEVLDHGTTAFSGSPSQAKHDPRLMIAYFGAPGSAADSEKGNQS